jgi:hypothetical protein
MLLLVAIAAFGVASSPPLTVPNPNTPAQQSQKSQSPEHNQPSLFLAVGTWARDNREAIDPLAAICALIVAIAVAIVTGFLWGATRKLAISTDELARAAHEQSAEMRLARSLAERHFDLEERRFLLTGRECDLAEKQHGLQREMYLAEHRPRIRIRSVAITQAPAMGVFPPDRIIQGSLVIVNTGASDAVIRQADYRFFYTRDGLPIAPPLEPGQVKPLFGAIKLPHPLPGHESCWIDIGSGSPIGHDVPSGRGGVLYIMGAVLFSDWNLKERWMGFCQEYISAKTGGGEGRFEPVKDPNYEYED